MGMHLIQGKKRKKKNYHILHHLNSPEANGEKGCNNPVLTIPRRVRRKFSLLGYSHIYPQNCLNTQEFHDEHKNKLHKKILPTHKFHTKRFHVSPPLSILDGWCVPLLHFNRGTNASLIHVKEKCTVQDATWAIGGTILKYYSNNRSKFEHTLSLIVGGESEMKRLMSDFYIRIGRKIGMGVICTLGGILPNNVIGPASFWFNKNMKKEGKELK